MNQGRMMLTVGNWSVLISLTFGGLLMYIFVVIYATVGNQDRFIRFDAPGSVEFELQWPGTYLVYEEFGRTPDKSEVIRPGSIEHLQAGVQHVDTGEVIELLPPDKPHTYKIQRTVAESIYQFQVEEPGKYRFVSEFTPGEEYLPLRLAIIPSPAGQVFFAFLWGTGLMVALIAFVLVLAWWMARRNARTATGTSPA